ncbi:MAG: phage tail tape measure protein [Azoarcus sp.]|jgi:TP901 family phage tail tape measure protein|nr:phage tail tape measure protein [Azoarcus sp.]
MADAGELTTRLKIVVSAAGTAALGVVIKDAIDFETAMSDVAKVVDGTDEEIAALASRIKELATEVPIAADALAGMAAAGGQLGVPIERLEEFIRLASEMSTAFGIGTEAAGQAVAKLANVFNLSLEGVRALGDAINVLGNNTAAAEKDIINVLTRIGGLSKQFGLTGQQAALASTMLSLGVSSEVAGTGINALLAKLQTANEQSSDFKEALQEIGMSAMQLGDEIRDNPQAALTQFLDTLSKLDASDRASVLTRMFGIEYQDDIARLLNGLEQYKAALDAVGDSSKTAGAMSKEFEKRLETTASQLKILENSAKVLATNLGTVLLPTIKAVAGSLADITAAVASFAENNPHITKVAVEIAGLITTVGALRMAFAAMGVTGTLSLANIGLALKNFGRLLTTSITQVRLLSGAVGALGAGFVGWELGKYLKEEYADAESFGNWLSLQLAKIQLTAKAYIDSLKAISSGSARELLNIYSEYKKALQEAEDIHIDMFNAAERARAEREKEAAAAAKAAEETKKAAKKTEEALYATELAAEKAGGAIARLPPSLEELTQIDLSALVIKISSAFADGKITAERHAKDMVRLMTEAFERAGAEAAQSLGVVGKESQEVIDSVDTIIASLQNLGWTAAQVGQALTGAFDGAIEKVNSAAALEQLRLRIEQLGKAGQLSGDQVAAALDKIRNKADDLTADINSVQEALRSLGVTSDRDLKRAADAAREAFNVIAKGDTSLRERQKAFRVYAEAVIAANKGVADAALKAQAAQHQMSISADDAGNVIIQTMTEARAATLAQAKAAREAADAMVPIGDNVEEAASKIDAATQSIDRSIRRGGEMPWLDAERAMSHYADEAGSVAQKIQQDVWSSYYRALGGRDGKEIAVEATRYQRMFYDALSEGQKAAARYVDQMEALDERQRQVMLGADSGVADLRLRLLEIEGTEEQIAIARLQRDKEDRNIQIKLLEIEAERVALAGNDAAAEDARARISALRQELSLLDQIYAAERRKAQQEAAEAARQEAARQMEEESEARSGGGTTNNIYIGGVLDVNDPVTLEKLGRQLSPVLGDLGRRGA